jgi:poly(hydroxyalkanoate) depolymerase family esterase
MRIALAAGAALMTGISLSAAAQSQPGSTLPDAAPAAAAEPAWSWHGHTVAEGVTHRYRLFLPPGGGRMPLLVMLHGCTQDPDDFARGTRMNEVAAELGFAVVYPEQTAERQPQRCWTWYDRAQQGRGGEAAAIAGIARSVAAEHGLDGARIYVAGISAGGAMAVNLAAAYPELFAAVAAHSALPYGAAGNVMEGLGAMKGGGPAADSLAARLRAALGDRTVPLLAVHGGADPVVLPANGRRLAEQWAAAHALAAPGADEAGTEGGAATRRTRWMREGAPLVELVVVDGVAHAWAGGSPEGTYTDARGPDASRLVARWLLRHVREYRP